MKKHLIIIGIAVVVLAGCLYGAYFLHGHVVALKSEAVTLRQDIQNTSVQVDRLVQLRKVSGNTGASEDKELIQGFFVSADGALDFIKYIESLANSNGLTFRIGFFDVEANADLAALDKEFLKTSVNVSGSLKNVRNFISLIESLPYNVKISKVDLRLTGADASPSREIWSGTIDFSVVKILEK